MRVLHVTPYWEGAWAYGGIPRVASALTRALVARGHEITVATTDACDARRRDRDLTGEPGLEVVAFPNLSNAAAYHLQLFLPRGLDRWLGREIGDFELVHIHGCHHLPGALAARHARARGIPYLLQPNGTAPRIERRRWAKRLFDATAGRGVLESAGRVLAVSRAEGADLRRLGVASERIRLVPNPVAPETQPSAEAAGWMRSRLGIPASAPLVAFLGRMTPRKRLDLVVATVAALPGTPCWLALGGNDGGARRQALRLGRRLGIAGRIRETGLLTGGERLALLAAADVVLYPGEHEVFGLVALEALAAGTPVVVAGDSGCGEVIEAIDGGEVVAGHEPEPFAAAVTRLLADGPRARARARTAAQWIPARFGPAIVADRTEDVYRELRA